MSESAFPEETKDFILDNIVSIEMLEILLFLYTNAERSLSAEDILKEIQSSQASIAQRLDELEKKGLIAKNAGKEYQFVASSNELVENVKNLKTCYTTWRVKVIEMIYSRQADGIQHFSDAFKLRKKK